MAPLITPKQYAGRAGRLPAVNLPRPSRSSSRRCQLRYRQNVARAKLANLCIASLNSLHSDFSNSGPPQTRHDSDPLPAATARAVAHVQSCAKQYVSRLAPSYQTGSSDDTSLFLDPCDQEFRDPCDLPTATYASSSSDAVELTAAGVALPSDPGGVDLLEVLPPDIAKIYAEPNPELFRPLEDQQTAPKAHLVRSPQDYAAIIRRMFSLGMVRFVVHPKVVNGCFGAPKSDGKIRFVVDGRPAKAVFVPCPHMEMTSPDHLARLEVPAGQVLHVAKADLDNMFHRMRVPEWMIPYFGLPPVRAADVGVGSEFGDDTMVHPCCTTLPMGWSHSAYLAQVAHEHLISTRTTLTPSDRINRKNDFKVDRTRHSVYIDDLGIMGTDSVDVDSRLEEYMAAMDAAGLPVKMSKTQYASCDGVELIGIDIHGRDLTVGVHPSKIHKLCCRTESLLRLGRCTGEDMQRLIGHWTWTLLPRRSAFSVMCKVYRFIESAGKRVFDIWPSVERELRVMIGLAPLLFSSLKSPWFDKTVATDASDSGMGVVSTPATTDELQEMSLAKPPLDNGPVDRSLHPTLVGKQWTDIVVSRFRFPDHINVKEMRALDTGVRWVASFPRAVGHRLMMWCDSTVCVFAVRKGRSSQWRLIRRLRALAATVLAFGIVPYVNWIPTEVNPADDPSRRYEFDSTLGFPGEGPPRMSPAADPVTGFDFDSTLGYPGEGPPGRPRKNFLIRAAYEDSTRDKYCNGVEMFVRWMDRSGENPLTVEELDEVFTEWIHDLYVEHGGSCRSHAESAMSGISVIMPAAKKQLHQAGIALKGWRKTVPSVPHPPLTWDLTVCIGVRLACKGQWIKGIGCLLAFDCYLRVGELVGLTRSDVADTGDRRLGSGHRGMALRLRKTKTGTNQWVTVRNPDVIALVRHRLQSMVSRRRNARLFPFAASTFRKHFKAACADLGLSKDYVPHSLRHGGATHDHQLGMTVEDIARHGRWASTKSARHYIQSGRALLLINSVPDPVAELFDTLVPNVLESFSLSQIH